MVARRQLAVVIGGGRLLARPALSQPLYVAGSRPHAKSIGATPHLHRSIAMRSWPLFPAALFARRHRRTPYFTRRISLLIGADACHLLPASAACNGRLASAWGRDEGKAGQSASD